MSCQKEKFTEAKFTSAYVWQHIMNQELDTSINFYSYGILKKKLEKWDTFSHLVDLILT
jgi:hypothetical protein